ncbi:MAG TPA: Uma2 family endonuclease [Chthonomonadaceae bacterium]|nr:Uma2 family endonuclease [Chthonomonadaceae bacterium]
MYETQPRYRHWTRQEYYCAAEQGIFHPDERLELFRGRIVQKMSPQGHPHAKIVTKTVKTLESVFASGCYVVSQQPLYVSEESEPEPDVMVVNGTVDDYEDHPTPADILLLVEVSDSTIRFDRQDKAALYAEAGVAEYWIINVQARTLEICLDPAPMEEEPYGFGYRSRNIYVETATVTPLAAPQSTVRVADLLPRPNA